jgi:hypothetical protein
VSAEEQGYPPEGEAAFPRRVLHVARTLMRVWCDAMQR